MIRPRTQSKKLRLTPIPCMHNYADGLVTLELGNKFNEITDNRFDGMHEYSHFVGKIEEDKAQEFGLEIHCG